MSVDPAVDLRVLSAAQEWPATVLPHVRAQVAAELRAIGLRHAAHAEGDHAEAIAVVLRLLAAASEL